MRKLTILSALTLLLFSCEKSHDQNQTSRSEGSITYPTTGAGSTQCGDPTVVALMAGQNDNVGEIGVWNDGDNIYVSYQPVGAYRLKKTHLFVGDCTAIPTNGAGNPRIGAFPNTVNHGNTGVDAYTYIIPLAGMTPGTSVCVAAHAEVVAFDANGNQYYSQTGWGNGDQINDGGSWAMKFTYTVQNCSNEGTTR